MFPMLRTILQYFDSQTIGRETVTKENTNPRTDLNVGYHTGNARHFLIITLFPPSPIVMS